MSDNLRDRISAVVIRHHTDCDDTPDGTWTQCECDAGWRREDEWAVHVAEAITDLLIDMAGRGELLKAIMHGSYCNRCGIPHTGKCLWK